MEYLGVCFPTHYTFSYILREKTAAEPHQKHGQKYPKKHLQGINPSALERGHDIFFPFPFQIDHSFFALEKAKTKKTPNLQFSIQNCLLGSDYHLLNPNGIDKVFWFCFFF